MNEDLETQTGRTLRMARVEWQKAIMSDVQAAVVAELDGEERSAMLRQLADIRAVHGLDLDD